MAYCALVPPALLAAAPLTLVPVAINVSSRQCADMAIVDPSAGGNPLPLNKDGATRIFTAAYQGRV